MDFMTGKKYKDKPELDSEYFWYALLAVPKGDRDREPSINKYSPLVTRAVSYSSVMQRSRSGMTRTDRNRPGSCERINRCITFQIIKLARQRLGKH